ncbi:hypothetical protein Taro_018701 [Colocasia esculenta]|uniref:Uncharacterized protein n=1 Tax=Colocasia esculenta TaxID=4460 RepID=A0A843UZX2_COLES|nr:hypothetical protein [Colocasia esculenta]
MEFNLDSRFEYDAKIHLKCDQNIDRKFLHRVAWEEMSMRMSTRMRIHDFHFIIIIMMIQATMGMDRSDELSRPDAEYRSAKAVARKRYRAYTRHQTIAH